MMREYYGYMIHQVYFCVSVVFNHTDNHSKVTTDMSDIYIEDQ